jgi:hypothetical protein
MKQQSRFLLLCFFLATPILFTACQQPLPNLNELEKSQRLDLQRYLGSTFRFHLYDCWADVSIDTMGRVTAFKPENANACERALANC